MFKNKVAIVTGAGGGLGREIAIQLAEQGAKVVVVNRTESKGLNTLEAIKAAGGEAIFVRAEATNVEDVKNYVAKTLETYGQIDIFINNAGISGNPTPLVQYEEEKFAEIIQTNVTGTFLGMKYVIGAMLSTGSQGAVLNTASMMGVTATPLMSAYTASKHAIVGMTKSAAYEYAEAGIRINALCPGFIATEMVDNLPEEVLAEMSQMLQRIPMKRAASAKEVAQSALFLVSDQSSYITGISHLVDGGINSSAVV